MSSFAQRCGIEDAARERSLAQTARLIEAGGMELVRFAWCDLHGVTRGKTLTAAAAIRAMRQGVGMVSTLLLKDSSDRTAFQVFEPGGTASCRASSSPAICCCCRIPAASGSCRGHRPPAGCAASPGSRTAGRWNWTRAACCSGRSTGCTRPAWR